MFQIDFHLVAASIPATIKFAGTFTNALTNASSPEYMTMAQQAREHVSVFMFFNST